MTVINKKSFRIFLYILGYISAAAIIAFSVLTAMRYSMFRNDIGTADDFAVTESMRRSVSAGLSNLQAKAAAEKVWIESGLEDASMTILDYSAGTRRDIALSQLANEAGFADARSGLISADRLDREDWAGSFSAWDTYREEALSGSDTVCIRIRKENYIRLFEENSVLYSEEQMQDYINLYNAMPAEGSSLSENFAADSTYMIYSRLIEGNYTGSLSDGDRIIQQDTRILAYSPDEYCIRCLAEGGLLLYQYQLFQDPENTGDLFLVVPDSPSLKKEAFPDVSGETAEALLSSPLFPSPLEVFFLSLDIEQQTAVRNLNYAAYDTYSYENTAFSFGKDRISGSEIYDGRGIEETESFQKLAAMIRENADIYISYDQNSGALEQWYKDPSGTVRNHEYVKDINRLTQSVDESFVYGANLYQSESEAYTVEGMAFAICKVLPSPVVFLVVSAVIFLLCVILLLIGVPARLLAIDRIPFEIFLAGYLILLYLVGAVLAKGLGHSVIMLLRADRIAAGVIVLTIILALYIITAALFTTIARRCKCKAFLEGLLTVKLIRLLLRGIRWLFRKISRGCEKISRSYEAALSGHRRLIIFASILFFVNALVLLFFVLMHEGAVLLNLVIIAAEAFAGYQLLKYSAGAEKVLSVSRQIEAGDLQAKTDPSELKYNIKELGESLNRLGEGFSKAVDSSVRDERTKAELITNVSHDIKTPLTSIISYVDLLKNEKIESERAQDYIKVLDQKSQRLKQLIEDLIEVSKTNTGNIELERTNLDLAELLEQAVGEYEERMTGCGLEPVVNIQAEKTVIYADGRRVFRILDNLLNNATKYAQPGTRVYIDLFGQKEDGKNIVLSIKNVSRERLNISAEELTERFVRGDRARHSEGSGLGLSIAKNLTELQDGTFALRIDGDLFTAEITFPAVLR